MPLWPWPANNGQAYAQQWDRYAARKVGILGPDGGTVLGQQGAGGPEEVPGEVHSSQASKSKSSPDVVRKHKSTTASKESKPMVSVSATSTPVVSEPFVALFGQPIKPNKPSPDSKKAKDAGGRSSSSSKSSKSGSSSGSRDCVPSPSSDSREGKASSHLKDVKPPTKENINKTGGKRPPLPPPSLPSSATTTDPKITNKENKGSSLKRPPSPLSPPPSDTNKEVKKRKSSSSSSSTKKSKDKHQTEKKEKVKEKESKKKETSQSAGHIKVPKEHEKEKTGSESSSKTKSVEKESKSSSKKKIVEEIPSKPKFHKETSVDSTKGAIESSKGSKSSVTEQRHSNSSSLDASPDSSISFSSLQISGKRGPLGALMAELDDQDDDDELVSPLSSDPPSPPHFSGQEALPIKVEPMESSPKREKAEKPKSKPNKATKGAPIDSENTNREKVTSSSDSNSSLQNLPVGACESDLNKLVALQRQLMLLTDRDHLQKVVDLIEETGQYSVSSSTFDFDLCALDKETVNKIYVCLVKPESVTS